MAQFKSGDKVRLTYQYGSTGTVLEHTPIESYHEKGTFADWYLVQEEDGSVGTHSEEMMARSNDQ